MTRRPGIALLRGEALNPYEMQAYAPLSNDFDLLAVGRQRPLYEVDRVPMRTVLLHSFGERRALKAIHQRASRSLTLPGNPDHLFGLRKAVAGREVLHAAETALPVSEQAAEISADSRSKLVLTCWETIPFRFDDDPVLAARKLKVKRATSRFIAVTDRAQQALIAEGVPSALIRVVPAAVDCQRFRPSACPIELRASWGVPLEALVILYVGRLIREKGLVELVRAFAAVAEESAHLVLIGSGDQAGRVRIAARSLGVFSRVHVRSAVSYALLPEVYAASDVVVAPSLPTPYWEEQFGMVLVEAMACGKPLLTTSSGAIPEVVGDSAELVEPYDVPALARALGGLLSSPARRRALGIAARRRAESRFDVPVIAPQIAAVYRELLGP